MKNFFEQRSHFLKVVQILVLVVVCILVGVALYRGHTSLSEMQKELMKVSLDFSENKVLFQKQIDELEDDIVVLNTQNKYLADTLLTEQQKNGSVAQQIGNITNSVSVLTKLAQSDPELLKKYSKVYFLNEHYAPLSLSDIEPQYIYQQNKKLQIHVSVYPKLKQMLDAAATDRVSLKAESAYRSFGTQAILKSNYKFTYGAGTANSFSAEQGYSEHQLGTTLDFTSAENNGTLAGFDQTQAYVWLKANAYKYGFVLSYPPNNDYYQYEPWHWRYVGAALAAKLHQDGTYFYDIDQRVIDSYLVDIFD